jgi:formate hydrogenlyase subunit 4
MIDTLVHCLVLLVLPPLLLGVINKTKAWFAGRKGAPFLQLYFDLFKLFRKGLVQSTTTTWIFRAGPYVTLAVTFLAGLLVPFGQSQAPISFVGDMILFAYLFALSRFFTTSAALDTGSAFEGMGSAREVTFAVLSEPALFFGFLVLAKLSGTLSLNTMLHGTTGNFVTAAAPTIVLLSLGLFIVLLAESCRIPVDDPNTHLELTMIHEAMVLDHGGPFIGMIEYASSLKLLVLGSILMNVALPFSTGIPWADWLLFIGEILGLSVLIGGVESVIARLRMNRVPYLLITALLLCGSSFLLLLR